MFSGHYLLIAMNLNQYSLASAQPGLAVGFIKNLLTVIPERKEQQEIVNYLDNTALKIDNLVSLKTEKIDTLKEYKQSLIYECVTGKRDCRPQEERA